MLSLCRDSSVNLLASLVEARPIIRPNSCERRYLEGSSDFVALVWGYWTIEGTRMNMELTERMEGRWYE